MVDLSRVIVGFIVINQFVVWFLRVDYVFLILMVYSGFSWVIFVRW
ncbi:hypothetical protein [uncultured Gammaproteobacteria bacterium]|nr:hypothetical protein [uncultured Gammaproteobacteria bacterium]